MTRNRGFAAITPERRQILLHGWLLQHGPKTVQVKTHAVISYPSPDTPYKTLLQLAEESHLLLKDSKVGWD